MFAIYMSKHFNLFPSFQQYFLSCVLSKAVITHLDGPNETKRNNTLKLLTSCSFHSYSSIFMTLERSWNSPNMLLRCLWKKVVKHVFNVSLPSSKWGTISLLFDSWSNTFMIQSHHYCERSCQGLMDYNFTSVGSQWKILTQIWNVCNFESHSDKKTVHCSWMKNPACYGIVPRTPIF